MEKYRLSKYNKFLVLKNNVVGLNLYRKLLFSIDKEKYDLLLSHEHNLYDLKKNYPILFSTMNKLGIIEEGELNIPQILLMKNRQQVFSNDIYKLIILPTLDCNFSCWYCYETHPKGKMSKKRRDSIIKYIDYLVKVEKIKGIDIEFFGGEPLMCYETVIKPFCIDVKKKCAENNAEYRTSMTSNAFFIKESMISFFQEHNINRFQITLDCNKVNHDNIRYYGKQKKGTFDIIIENIQLLAKNNINVLLRINYTKDSIDNCIDIIENIPESLRNNIQVILVQIWQDRNNNSDSDRQLLIEKEENIYKLFEIAGFFVKKNKFSCDLHYSCYADLNNSAVINYDGRVFKCTTADFVNSPEEGILSAEGRIIWNESAISKRLAKATFDNEICLECSILPICSGGCSTNSVFSKLINNECSFKPSLERNITSIMECFEETGYKLCHLNELQKLMSY